MQMNNENWQAIRPLFKYHLIDLYLHDVERTGFDKTLTVIESCNGQEQIFQEIASETIINGIKQQISHLINIFFKDAFDRATDPQVDGYYLKECIFDMHHCICQTADEVKYQLNPVWNFSLEVYLIDKYEGGNSSYLKYDLDRSPSELYKLVAQHQMLCIALIRRPHTRRLWFLGEKH